MTMDEYERRMCIILNAAGPELLIRWILELVTEMEDEPERKKDRIRALSLCFDSLTTAGRRHGERKRATKLIAQALSGNAIDIRA